MLPLVLLLSLSCATAQRREVFEPVQVSSRVVFRLLPPGDIEKPLDMAQSMSGNSGEILFTLNCWVRADATGIFMNFFNEMGADMGELEYTVEGLSFFSPYVPKNFKAEYLIADFQFCFYNFEALASGLGGLKLERELSGGIELRRIYEGDRLLIEIEKSPSHVRYDNRLRSYTYMITGDFS
jgi:hypothetical protein